MSSNVVLTSSEKLLTHGKKIVAIGRNYAEHAKELGNAVPKEPFFFLKPTTSYIRSGGRIELPKQSTDDSVHHEIELGVVIGSRGKDLSEEQAMSIVSGYILALDITERTVQGQAKRAGKPWSMAKGFDTFCPISDSIVSTISPSARLWCKVNGEMRQDGSVQDMIFPIPKLISYISNVMTLEENDVILTGTPPGVGPIKAGDKIEGGLDDILHLKFDVVGKGK